MFRLPLFQPFLPVMPNAELFHGRIQGTFIPLGFHDRPAPVPFRTVHLVQNARWYSFLLVDRQQREPTAKINVNLEQWLNIPGNHRHNAVTCLRDNAGPDQYMSTGRIPRHHTASGYHNREIPRLGIYKTGLFPVLDTGRGRSERRSL